MMKNSSGFSHIRDTCIDFLKNEETKKDVKDIIRPIVDIIYNENYVYIWFICLYHVFLVFLILANLYLLHILMLRIFSLNISIM